MRSRILRAIYASQYARAARQGAHDGPFDGEPVAGRADFDMWIDCAAPVERRSPWWVQRVCFAVYCECYDRAQGRNHA